MSPHASWSLRRPALLALLSVLLLLGVALPLTTIPSPCRPPISALHMSIAYTSVLVGSLCEAAAWIECARQYNTLHTHVGTPISAWLLLTSMSIWSCCAVFIKTFTIEFSMPTFVRTLHAFLVLFVG